MCDVDKMWAAMLNEGSFELFFPTPELQAIVRKDIIEQVPVFLAEHLAKPVTAETMVRCWLAYTRHYLTADVYGKILEVSPDDSLSLEADKAEGAAQTRICIDKLEKALAMMEFVPLRQLTEPEVNASCLLAQAQARGIAWPAMTVGELVSLFPGAFLKMG